MLKYLGTEGNNANNRALGNHFGIGEGTAEIYRERAMEAVISLESQAMFWPDIDERREIAIRFKATYGTFSNCVGIADGTLLPLAFKPTLDGESYLCRKRFYALNMLVICDDLGRIIYYVCGWPGSVHDNRVWRTSALCVRHEDFFLPKEHLLGDSAFHPSSVMIPAYKTSGGSNLTHNQHCFNKILSKPRVKSEHSIGLLKGRFPYLKNIRIVITRREDLQKINRYVKAAVILHNILIDAPYLDEWIDEEFLNLGNDDDLRRQCPGDRPNDNYREAIMEELAELPNSRFI
jgi:hypothetical protein